MLEPYSKIKPYTKVSFEPKYLII